MLFLKLPFAFRPGPTSSRVSRAKNKKLPGLAKVAVVDRMAGLADIARFTGVGKFARLIRVATREYCLVWFELPCWSERPGPWWWGVSGQE